MKPFLLQLSNRTATLVLTSFLTAFVVGTLAAQELEIKRSEAADFVSAPGAELPLASSFEELVKKEQARQATANADVAPAAASPSTGTMGNVIREAAPKPMVKPKSTGKLATVTLTSGTRPSVSKAPVPRIKPGAAFAIGTSQGDEPEEPNETPLVDVVDSFSAPEPKEFDDSARR